MKFARRHLGKALLSGPFLIASYLRAQEAAAVGPGVVHLAARRYDEDLTIDTGVTFAGQGPGATSVRSITSRGFYDKVAGVPLWDSDRAEGPQGICVRDLRVEGSAGSGVSLYAPAPHVENVIANNNALDGFWFRWSNDLGFNAPKDMMEGRFLTIEAHDNGRDGIAHDGAHDSKGVNWEAHMNGGIGINLGPKGGPLQLVNGNSWGRTQRIAWQVLAANASLTNCKGECERDAVWVIRAPGVHGTSIRAYGITSKPTIGLLLQSIGADLGVHIENCAVPVKLEGAAIPKVHGTILHQFSLSQRPVVVGRALGADIRLNDKERRYVHRREPSYARV